MDIRAMVDALVDAEKAPKESQLNRLERTTNTKISAIGQFKSALSSFETALKKLNSASLYQQRAAVSADESIFTVTAGSRSVAGKYDIQVLGLAQGSKVSLAGVDSADTVIGTGTLNIKIGDESLDVEIAEGKDTLADIRDAINAAGKENGLSATIVTDPGGAGGSRLVLNSTATGAGKDISVAATGSEGLAVLEFPASAAAPDGDRAPRMLTAASDARFSIDGIVMSSASNTIEGAIEGVSLTLNAAQSPDDQAAGKKLALTVSEDLDAVKSSVTEFVDSYNQLMRTIGSLTKVTPGAGEGAPSTGALVGDASVRSFTNGVRSELSSPSDGEIRILADLGITTERDGSLKLDAAKLDKVLENGTDKLSTFFAGENGLMARLESRVKPYTQTGGLLDNRNTALQSTIADVRDQREALERRTASLEARLLAQFNAMDSMVGQLMGTSNYLTGVLESLPGVVKQSK
ncbi:flagellar filament capping protein FliD [Halopseudomonas pertucinogena]|uniref:Flagellar hook-associated protein 2 n=1 Tax=Halopseudomonas pertucinogena TaxID=86175 RepID=A0ABQ2CQ55_9GAMM|nr:flagellar filament capping protein FliD [Halopseudomonas pertucinogena]GGI98551.1 B-type flagellar hook-associated protein 2 [Halopseudomonas pertucinogena]